MAIENCVRLEDLLPETGWSYTKKPQDWWNPDTSTDVWLRGADQVDQRERIDWVYCDWRGIFGSQD